MTPASRADLGVITIDGPAASGKSSVARGVAHALGVPFVSSGLLYRAATVLVARAGIDPGDEAAVMAALSGHAVALQPGTSTNRVRLDDEDVSDALHTAAVDAGVSQVAAHPAVRAWVGEQLRRVPPPFAIDGRDMGSTVFPDARHKFYLTASLEERARRRAGERDLDPAAVASAMARRDALDARQLEPAPDARHIDTDELELDQVIERVLAMLRAAAAAVP